MLQNIFLKKNYEKGWVFHEEKHEKVRKWDKSGKKSEV